MNLKIFFNAALLVLVIDQILKLLIINKVLDIAFITNTGAAFGMLKNMNLFFAAFSFLVLGVIAFYNENVDIKYSLFVGLLVGGILGNLADRIFLGHVIDFIDVGFWPAFNVADACINIGVFGIIWKSFQNSSDC